MTPFCGLLRLRIQRRRFGLAALKVLQKSGGSKFWGLLWELPPSSGHGFSPRLNTIGCFLAASRPFKICSLRGSSSSVPPLGPLATSRFATQSSPLLLPDSTTSRECLATLLGHTPPQSSWELPVFRCTWGGIGLSQCGPRCLRGTLGWADCLHTVAQRHENIAHTMAEALSSPPVDAVHIGGAVASRRQLATIGYDCPDWASLLEGARPRQPNFDEVDPGVPTHGWQSDVVWPRLSTTEQALLRSQSGPMSGLPFSSVWPSRRPWPPPCSVFESGSLGESGVLLGERSGTGLP